MRSSQRWEALGGTSVLASWGVAVLCTGLLTPAALAGPKGTIQVRFLGDRQLTIDGDLSDWPLDKFKTAAQQPLFPEGQTSSSTTAAGDHLVFDKTRVGLFNGTGGEAFSANDSDFGVSTYFAYDRKFLYILSVCIDDQLRDDKDTTEYGASGFLNDGFEFFLDTKGDSTDCIADDAFPAVDTGEPNADDLQVTVAINSHFKPAGSAANILGARQSVERAGTMDLVGPEKAGPGGIYRDQLDLLGGPDIAARKYDDLRAAGAKNPEIAAKPDAKFTGYVVEMRIPLRGKIPNLTADHAIGFELFWRDVDADEDPGVGGGGISWASWAQSTDVACSDPQVSLFNSANWGRLVFDATDPLVPFPADRPRILFVAASGDNPINADADLMDFLDGHGYVAVPFTSAGSTPEGLREAAAATKGVFISESIGSTSVLDPAGSGTGVFSLKDTDIPVISFEAYMYDNADWVVRTDDGSNDWINWGNTGRSEVDAIGLGDALDSMYIRKADHPLAAGLSGKVKVYKEPYSFNFGIPSADADVIASVNADGTYPTFWVYEKGDKLVDGSVAPNKRIGLFLGQAANPNANTVTDLANLTAEGQQLLLATLNYAVPVAGTAPSLTIASVRASGADLVLSWNGGKAPYKIQRRDAVNVGAWTDVTTTSATTATVARSGGAGFLRVVSP